MKHSSPNAHVLILLVIIFITGCSPSAPDEAQIKKDLINSSLYSNYLSENETIDSVEISKRNTDAKQDNVWIDVSSSTDEIKFVKHFAIEYTLYDTGGWIIHSIEEDHENQWGTLPLEGVSEAAIKNALMYFGYTVEVDSVQWTITENTLKELVIQDQSTSLENLTEKVIVDIVLESEVLESKCSLTLDFVFDYGWYLNTVNLKEPFETEYKANLEPNITPKDLITAMPSNPIYLSSSDVLQTITMDENEINDVKITETRSTRNGQTLHIDFDFVLDKPLATLDVTATAEYYYDPNENWVLKKIDYTPNPNKFKLDGVWNGTYSANQGETNVRLTLSDVDENGFMEALFEFSATPTNRSIPSGSFKMKGGFDPYSLYIFLEGTEWIDQPDNYIMLNLSAYIDLGESMILSIDEYSFKLNKK